MAAQVRLARGDLLAHVCQYAAQTGMSESAALARYGLEVPQVPQAGVELWEWFQELASGRGHTGFGPLPLSWQEMDAWARISGLTLRPWQARILRAMDDAWLNAATEQPVRDNTTTRHTHHDSNGRHQLPHQR